jgi:hypothetical protein
VYAAGQAVTSPKRVQFLLSFQSYRENPGIRGCSVVLRAAGALELGLHYIGRQTRQTRQAVAAMVKIAGVCRAF